MTTRLKLLLVFLCISIYCSGQGTKPTEMKVVVENQNPNNVLFFIRAKDDMSKSCAECQNHDCSKCSVRFKLPAGRTEILVPPGKAVNLVSFDATQTMFTHRHEGYPLGSAAAKCTILSTGEFHK